MKKILSFLLCFGNLQISAETTENKSELSLTSYFDPLLALLEDFSRFEEIMGQSEETFLEEWIEHLKTKLNLPSYKETEHFNIYCTDQDREVADLIAQNLENRFEELSSRYHFTPTSHIAVSIYPDSKSFHNAIGMPNASKGVVGSWEGGNIQMVSPLAPNAEHSYESRLLFTPIIAFVCGNLSLRYPQTPRWLKIGVGCYESGNYPVKGVRHLRIWTE